MSFLTTVLQPSHEKSNFSCGKAILDHYLHKQAKQDLKGKVSACFVLSDDAKEIKGYYTLSNGSIPRDYLPTALIKKIPKYKDLPVTILGRLAVDKKYHSKKLGQLLLIDALKRSYEASVEIGSMAVVVDPLDLDAQNFYLKFGFIALPDSGRLFLPMATISFLF